MRTSRWPAVVWADTCDGSAIRAIAPASTQAATWRAGDNRVMTVAFYEDAKKPGYLTSRSSSFKALSRSCVSVDKFVWTELDDGAVFDAHAQRVHVPRALALRLLHQLVGAREQFMRELARHVATLLDAAEQQADD